MEEEIKQLKHLVADLSLDKQMLQDVIKKSFESGSEAGISRFFNEGLPGIGTHSLLSRSFTKIHVLLQK